MKHILVVVYLVLLLVPWSMRSAERRVSTAGEISTAMTTAQPGDTLTMTNGIWADASIMFAGYGTATAPIVLRGESYGGVVLTGASTLRISGRCLVVDGLLFRNGHSPSGAVIEFQGSNGESDSCRLTNCSIEEYNPADLTVDYKWVSLYGAHNRVDHCYLRGKRHQGSTLVVWVDSTKPNFHLIDHNYFGPRPPLPNNGGETIRVGTGIVSDSNSCTVVEYNYFEKCNGDPEIVSNKSCGNVYRYNTFVSCQGTVSMRQGSRATLEGNFILGNHVSGAGGIRLMGTDHRVSNNYVSGVTDNKAGCALAMMDGTPPGVTPSYDQVKRVIVAFNTFVDNNYTIGLGITGSGRSLPPDSCTIANNVGYSTSTYSVVTLYDTPTNLAWQGNIFYGATLGMTPPGGITWLDPQMAVAADGLWRPGSTSPVVGASVSASSYPSLADDMDGQPRDAAPDVGADEQSPASFTRRPLTPADVGPPLGMITSVVDRDENGGSSPRDCRLEQNYPNPFNPSTRISFGLAHNGDVTLKIYDLLGREVATVVEGVYEAGTYTATWDASGFSSGVYFCMLTSGRHVATKRIVLMK